MRSARVASTVGATAVSSVASPAQARHTCGLDPFWDAVCESHVENPPLLQKLSCPVSPDR